MLFFFDRPYLIKTNESSVLFSLSLLFWQLDDWVLCRIYKKNNTQRPMDHESDDLNDMLGSIPPSIPFAPPQKIGLKPSNYGALLQTDHHNMFDQGLVTSDGSIGGARSSQLPFVPASATPNLLPTKRSLPGLFWNVDDSANNHHPADASPPTKRFLADNNGASISRSEEQNGSIATLLSQLPQTPSLHQQTMLGALNDGVFRQPYQVSGINWYSWTQTVPYRPFDHSILLYHHLHGTVYSKWGEKYVNTNIHIIIHI